MTKFYTFQWLEVTWPALLVRITIMQWKVFYTWCMYCSIHLHVPLAMFLPCDHTCRCRYSTCRFVVKSLLLTWLGFKRMVDLISFEFTHWTRYTCTSVIHNKIGYVHNVCICSYRISYWILARVLYM